MTNKLNSQQQKTFNENSVIKLMIIEDNRFTRIGWESVIQANKNFNLVGSFSDCESAFSSEAVSYTHLTLPTSDLV